MALFHTDFQSFACSNVQNTKQWWIDAFDAKAMKVPADWDCQLPSDVALALPGADQPTILLSDRTEIEQAGYDRRDDHNIIFCSNLKKAHRHLVEKHVAVASIQESGGTQFFEITDTEGRSIDICKEP